jgi:hypothetical protein
MYRKLQYVWEEISRHKAAIYGALCVSLIFAVITVFSRNDSWNYMLQFAIGGWPEGFVWKDVSLLLLFVGVTLQGFLLFGIPAIVVSILHTLLTRSEVMRLVQFIRQRDREVEVTITDAIFRRLGELVRQDDRYGSINEVVKEAILEADNKWREGQLEQTKIDIEKARITVAGDSEAGRNYTERTL